MLTKSSICGHCGPKEPLMERIRAQSARPVGFYGEMIGSMKMLMRADLEKYAASRVLSPGETVNTYIRTIMGTPSPLFPGEGNADCMFDTLPDIIVSNQMSGFLTGPFFEMARKKDWEVLPRLDRHPAFSDCGLDDMCGGFYIFGACPFVFMIDKEKLGSLPVPHSWEDIFDTAYRGRICINGTRHGPDITILLYLCQRFGMDRLLTLHDNIASSLHGSSMARNIATGRNGNIAIYLSTAFFAYAHGEDERISIIWPEDGAPFQPCTLLVKKGCAERYRWVIDYVLGKRFGSLLSKNWYPSTRADLNGNMLDGKKLCWCGWEYLNDRRTPDVIAKIREIFADRQKKVTKGEG